MSEDFTGKVALVTGAASGIGRATALEFARQGADLLVADVTAEALEEVARAIGEMGRRVVASRTDVSAEEQVQALAARAMGEWGRLDCAANIAGIEGEMAPTAETGAANWDRIMAVNLRGTWLCLRYEIPAMLQNGGGAIVNMSSISGLVGFAGLPAYNASKGGIIALTRTAAVEYAARGVRVNAVCPGAIRTPMVDRVVESHPGMEQELVRLHPLGRVGEPSEVAQAVVWLCSAAASFITGVALPVDGGFTAQ